MDGGYQTADNGKPVSSGSIWLHRGDEGYGHDHVLTVQPDRITTGRGGTWDQVARAVFDYRPD